ncbi:MAG TPA: PIN domain-containing protein [Terriglobales bacterium]|nr:PIN domain-containing protein [Terriglobales bacterium]
MSLAFFDTNILVYRDDASTPAKQERASTLLDDHLTADTAVLSLQVLQEYFATITRKLHIPMETAQRQVELFSCAKIVRFEMADLIAAIELHRLTRISFWDAMIVHAARAGGAAVLYSEDFQHGTVMGGVRIVNPFRV